MTPIPRIVIYESAETEGVDRFVRFFFQGKQRLPVVFNGQDRGALIVKMRDFWVSEQAKIAKKHADRAASSARLRRAVA